MAKETNTQDLQIELLKSQVENLTSKIVKPKNSEEEYQERVTKYESKQAERDVLLVKIEQRRMEIMMMPELMGKARMDEAILLESFERRALNIQKTNPNFAVVLQNAFKRKIRDIQKDTNR
jgi:uncharacterized protein (DUF342 family)